MEWLLQMIFALGYYGALVLMVRIAGKRLAGQTTTYDLIVLISLSVVLQQIALRAGTWNAVVFILTVFAVHVGLSALSRRHAGLRRLLRGGSRLLVVDGKVSDAALAAERLSYEDLLAGLRKAGVARLASVKMATLEETGEISVILSDQEPATR